MNPTLTWLAEERAPILILSSNREEGLRIFKEIGLARVQLGEFCAALEPEGDDFADLSEAGVSVLKTAGPVTASSFIKSTMRMDPSGLLIVDPSQDSWPLLLQAFLVGSEASTVLFTNQSSAQDFVAFLTSTSTDEFGKSFLAKFRIVDLNESAGGAVKVRILKIESQGASFVLKDHEPRPSPPVLGPDESRKAQFEFSQNFSSVQGNLVFSPPALEHWTQALWERDLREVGSLEFSSGRLVATSAIMNLRSYLREDGALFQVPRKSCRVLAALVGPAAFQEAEVLSFRWQERGPDSQVRAVCLQALDWGTSEDGVIIIDKSVLGVFDLASLRQTLGGDEGFDQFVDSKVLNVTSPILLAAPSGLVARTDRGLVALLEFDENLEIRALHFVSQGVERKP